MLCVPVASRATGQVVALACAFNKQGGQRYKCNVFTLILLCHLLLINQLVIYQYIMFAETKENGPDFLFPVYDAQLIFLSAENLDQHIYV